MAVRPVLEVPHPLLHAPTRAPGPGDDVNRVLGDLIDTMEASPACVGLAANQIGSDLRIAVVDVTAHPKAGIAQGLLILVDPVVVETSPLTALAREGCMSVPHLTGDVARVEWVRVRATDGQQCSAVVEVHGFEARAVLHEIDHLDGHVFLDRVASRSAVFRRRVYK